MASEWDRLIEYANMTGQDDLRRQYIKYRDAGISKTQIESQGGVDLGGGYGYDSLYGNITYDDPTQQGYEYKYDPYADTTRYGGFDFSGKYNPDILGSITDQDYTSAEAQWQGDYDARMGQFGNMSDAQFTRFYKPTFTNTGDGYQMHSRGFEDAQQGIQDQYQNNVLKSAYEQAAGRFKGDTSFFDTLGKQDYTDYYKQQQPTSQDYNLDHIMNSPDMSDTMKAYYVKQAQQQGQDVNPEYLPEPTPEQPKAYDRTDPSTWPENQTPSAAPTPQQPTAATYAEDLADQPTMESTGGQIEQPWSADFEKQFLDQLSGFGQTLNTYLGTQQAASQPTTPKFSLQSYLGGQRNSGLNTGSTPTMFSPQQGIAPSQSSTGKAGQSNKQSLWR